MADGSGGDTQAPPQVTNTVQTSAPTNPDITAAQSAIAKGISSEAAKPGFAYDQPLYVPSGSTTQQGQSMALDAAGNPDFSAGIGAALGYNNNLIRSGGLTPEQQGLDKSYADLGGAYDTTSTAEQRLRSNLINDTLTNVNGIFNNSGRFGGGSNNVSLGEGLGNALAGFDTNIYDKNVANQYNSLGARAGLAQQGVANVGSAQAALPGLFSANQLPAGIYGAVGNAQDTNANATRQADADLQTRLANAESDKLAKLSSIGSGNASGAGQVVSSSTSSPGQAQTPWWLSALGIGASLL